MALTTAQMQDQKKQAEELLFSEKQQHGFAKALADPCPGPCRGKPLPVRRSDSTLTHWRGGNTLFYEIPVDAARSWLPRTDRIVVHETAAP